MRPFVNVPNMHPGRSVFDLSYDKKFTCDMGQLIPVMCDHVVPGDKMIIGTSAFLRMQPLVGPIMHEVIIKTRYFFVPYRLLWSHWVEFITGGVDGQSEVELPEWIPTPTTGNALGSLWDFIGFPPGVDPNGAYPHDFPRSAYNMVYNEYFRDETLQSEVALTNESILNVNWYKDYFTSALPWTQRGVSPALPIAGTSHAVWPAANFVKSAGTNNLQVVDVASPTLFTSANAQANANAKAFFAANSVDLSVASTFDVADLRRVVQLQKWMERNAHCGIRYNEFLAGHFNTSPRDETLQRPEYIGGTSSPVIISEVLQTSSTDEESPQGNFAGHGIGINAGHVGSYFVKEYGLILGLMYVVPKPAYSQGINRQWLYKTKEEFYFPEFAHLSEQAIERAEIYATNNESANQTIFGYQGRYDEMRYKPNMVCSEMRTVFDYMHLSREFSSAPLLNSSFITCVPRKDIYAVPSVPGLIVWFGNHIKAIRPLPVVSNPGYLDHF